jgi:TolB-like protein/Flp pilus assembly protein TadD
MSEELAAPIGGQRLDEPSGALQPRRASRDVFISYASQDNAVADAILEALERQGIACWIAPRDVVPGEFYADAIVHAIDAAKVILLVLSQNAAASPHVLREVERASSKRHPVVSFRIDLAPLPAALEYFLNTSHWLDASVTGVDRSLPKLVDALQRIVTPAPVVEPTRSGDTVITGADVAPHVTVGIRASRRPSRSLVAIAAAIAVIAAYFVVDKLWLSKRVGDDKRVGAAAPAVVSAATAISEKSIAVLPFTDMSEKKDQEYFADGMAEEILDLLTRVPGLLVIARTSSFQFKGKSEDLRTIGAMLSAAYVVEGSVRASGSRLRVTAQLIDTQSGRHVWSNSYDREIGDALRVQSEIAQGLVRAVELSMGADGWWPTQSLRSSEAYTEYLRGRHAMDRFDPDGLQEAVSYLTHALELDPTLTRAAETLAFAEDARAEWGFVPAREGFGRAREAAETALRLDPNTVIAHVAMARVNAVYEWDWSAAEAHVREALRIGPRSPAAIMAAGDLARTLGRWDEATRYFSASIAADPLFPVTHVALGWVYYRSGRLDKAEVELRRALEISPTYVAAHWTLGKILLARGRYAEALRVMQQETPEGGRDAGLALAYFALGQTSDSDKALRRLIESSSDSWASAIAQVYAFRGNADLALRWLDRAYAQKDIELYLMKGDPVFSRLETDPRYMAFLRKMKLLE